MPDFSGFFGTAFDLLLVVIGFGLIIFLHELGHFVAARWAGIRVLAFAIGFGPAAFSYRKGMGFRRGSSEPEYAQRLMAQAAGVTTIEGTQANSHEISPTEYRFNWLPFGGYVKMLGQEDLNPDAVSDAPDSYQRCVPWKRMVVICAGVVMNLITAALLFIVVFRVGLRTEAPVVGEVAPGKPAALALAVNGAALGVKEPGLRPDDRILSVDGTEIHQFGDVVMAAAMAPRDKALDVIVQRPGIEEPLRFSITPQENQGARLLELGVYGARSATLESPTRAKDRELYQRVLENAGVKGVTPGMTLASINGGGPVRYAGALDLAAERSGGKPLHLVFEGQGSRANVTVQPQPEYQRAKFTIGETQQGLQPHLLGMTGVMTVAKEVGDQPPKQGLQPGDVFVRLGAVEYPSFESGRREIRASTGKEIPAVVRRRVGDEEKDVVLTLVVSAEGTIGFQVGDTTKDSALLGCVVASSDADKPEGTATPAARARIMPGSVVTAVDGTRIANFGELRAALIAASGRGNQVVLTLRPPGAAAGDQQVTLALSSDDARALQGLGWTSRLPVDLFEPAQVLLKSTGSLDAIALGLAETKRMILRVYLTFGRLFEGTLKVQHLQGPVGIAHVGTLLADRGFVWLLFFMAMVSVNLAVVNFLPLPIVDGGQFLFILYEQIFKRPVPAGFQNAVTLAGLLLIGSLFLIVTFNDISNLLRS
ncbi:MAG: site-2 protease family protein [Phycisphaerales bacterium]|nr:site-2 protease family protein [Planctomycetota bacterium]